MRKRSGKLKEPAEKVVRDIRRATRKQYSAEEKIRIVLEGLRGEDSIAELCRRGGRRRIRGAPRRLGSTPGSNSNRWPARSHPRAVIGVMRSGPARQGKCFVKALSSMDAVHQGDP